MHNYWVHCESCGHDWLASFSAQMGLLFAVDSDGEECVECGSGDVSMGEEYHGSSDDWE